jgi:hypothetical protein
LLLVVPPVDPELVLPEPLGLLLLLLPQPAEARRAKTKTAKVLFRVSLMVFLCFLRQSTDPGCREVFLRCCW